MDKIFAFFFYVVLLSQKTHGLLLASVGLIRLEVSEVELKLDSEVWIGCES